MASNSETGHAVNIANFKEMIDTCTSFAGDYQPTNPLLNLGTMNTQWSAANTAHETLSNALFTAKGPINARGLAHEPLDKLITRTINGFAVSGVDHAIVSDAKTLANDIRGFNAHKPKGPNAPDDPAGDPEWVSQSHQSYVQRVDHFNNFINLLTGAGWAPNELDLQLSALTALYATLKGLNDNIGNILVPIKNAMITRDQLLYTETTGMVDVALDCKKYVKSVYGGTNVKSRLVDQIKFKNLKRKDILHQ
ncbi:MAG: hypothetical protein IPP77_05540 [Bacteroidetes bacterium]|nr:hypothetical protein [Bacteroidota bacterium]